LPLVGGPFRALRRHLPLAAVLAVEDDLIRLRPEFAEDALAEAVLDLQEHDRVVAVAVRVRPVGATPALHAGDVNAALLPGQRPVEPVRAVAAGGHPFLPEEAFFEVGHRLLHAPDAVGGGLPLIGRRLRAGAFFAAALALANRGPGLRLEPGEDALAEAAL